MMKLINSCCDRSSIPPASPPCDGATFCKLLSARTLLGCSGRGPIKPEVLPQIKDKILHLNNFSPSEGDDADAAVLADATRAVCEVDVPMRRHHVSTAHGKNVLGTNLLDIEVDLRILPEELATPFGDGRLAGECAARPHFARVDKNTIVAPGRHESIEVVVTQRSEGFVDSLSGDNGTNHGILHWIK